MDSYDDGQRMTAPAAVSGYALCEVPQEPLPGPGEDYYTVQFCDRRRGHPGHHSWYVPSPLVVPCNHPERRLEDLERRVADLESRVSSHDGLVYGGGR